MKTFEQYLKNELGMSNNYVNNNSTHEELNKLILEYSDHLYDEILDETTFKGLDPDFLLSLHDDSIYAATMMVENVMISRYESKEVDVNWLDQFISDEEQLNENRLYGEFEEEFERDCYNRAIDMNSSFNGGYYG